MTPSRAALRTPNAVAPELKPREVEIFRFLQIFSILTNSLVCEKTAGGSGAGRELNVRHRSVGCSIINTDSMGELNKRSVAVSMVSNYRSLEWSGLQNINGRNTRNNNDRKGQ
jgi:hypothetical protein